MDERNLYAIIDFILNKAESHELEVIRAALRKREGNDPSDDGASYGKDIGKMARDMATSVSEQVGASETQIRDTVRNYVRQMIHREAPELRKTQVDELLNEWVPDPGKKPPPKAGGLKRGSNLPGDVLLTMVRQFTAFSTGAMTAVEESAIEKEMPDWQKRYWGFFSPVTRKLVSLYVKGIVAEAEFWEGIYDDLGLDTTPSQSSPS